MVYLLHFARSIGDPDNPRGQAQHYLGYCAGDRLDDRLAEHRRGIGSSITAYLVSQGIDFECVRCWTGDRTLERKIKGRKETPQLCPICSPERWHRRGNYSANWQPGIAVTFAPIEALATAPADCPF